MSENSHSTLISSDGHARLIAERQRLWSEERPGALAEIELAAGNIDRWEKGNDSGGTRKRLMAIDRRIAEIDTKLLTLLIAPDPVRDGKVRFGTRVRWRRANGREAAATIVGVDETSFEPDRISIAAPIAQAMLGLSAGETAYLETPAGEEQVEVIEISYPA